MSQEESGMNEAEEIGRVKHLRALQGMFSISDGSLINMEATAGLVGTDLPCGKHTGERQAQKTERLVRRLFAVVQVRCQTGR